MLLLKQLLLTYFYLEQFYNIMVVQWNGETGLFLPHCFI